MKTNNKWMGLLSLLSLILTGIMPVSAQTKGVPEDPAVPHFITLESSGDGVFKGETKVLLDGTERVIGVDTTAAVDLPHASVLAITVIPDEGWSLKRLTTREATTETKETELLLDAPVTFPNSHIFSLTLERNTILHAYFEREAALVDTIAVNENDTVIGADGPVVLEHLKISGKTGADTTVVVLKDVTVKHLGESLAATVISQASNVVLELDGEVQLDKIENNGTLILRDENDVHAKLTYQTVENMGVFIDETGLVTEVEGSIAALSVTPLEDQYVTTGNSVTLTAEAYPKEGYHLTFQWERLLNGVWAQATDPDIQIDESTSLRNAQVITSQLSVASSETGKYRCMITNRVGEVTTSLCTFAEVNLKSEPNPEPEPTPDPNPDPIEPDIPTGVDSAEGQFLQIWGANGQLHIRSPKAETTYIVTFDGQINKLTIPAGETVIKIPQGVYIIRIDNKSYKIKL
ncbi:InlB B-repeat-containing protein [Parabacteroides distasonis]|uniref:Ig-like domain-containing protein n=1 Tax=Parabacteroides distasonis TaxID=823 RepID=A0A5C6KEN7_PARDI|nr:hypothetical protein [Parabacteroides distasonis]TWV60391.1 hypothetical protein FSA05_14045 [Parabacteroides distasonis]